MKKLTCPNCGNNKITYLEKFRAISNSPRSCGECGAKYARPIYMSKIALVAFVTAIAFDKSHFLWKLLLLVFVIFGEYVYFQVEVITPISENQTKYLTIFIILLFFLLILWLSGPLLFGKVFLP